MSSSHPRAVIAGSGHAALTLATALLADKWTVDLFTRHSAPEIMAGPAGLTQLTLPSVHATEQALGLGLWQYTAPPAHEVRLRMDPRTGADPFGFTAPLPGAAIAVDHRLKSAYWLQHVHNLGGRVYERTCTAADVRGFAAARLHDLIVVGSGSDSALSGLFEPDLDRTGGTTPRVIVQVHLRMPDEQVPEHVEVFSCPWGEIMIYPVLTVNGLSGAQMRVLAGMDAPPMHVTPYAGVCVQVMAHPGSPWDPTPPESRQEQTGAGLPRRGMMRTPWEHVLQLLPPALADEYAQGTVVPGSELIREVHPQVRHPVTTISGAPVIGIGDVTMTTEHASAQSAGASTWVATVLRDQVRQHHQTRPNQAIDEAFLRGAWDAYWVRHGQYTRDFNEFVSSYWDGSLPAGVVEAFVETVSTPAGAAAWAEGLDDAARMHHLITPALVTRSA